MFKQKILLVLSVIFFMGCSMPKEPEFNRMENTMVQKISSGEILINTDAIFDNPNGFGVTVSSINLIAKANDVKTADIKQLRDVKMIGNDEFAIPLQVKIKPKELLNMGNLLKLVAGSLEQKVDLNYKGTVTAKVMDLSYELPIDYSEEVLLKK
jgi:LEA14-like dessication related protein